MLDQGAGMVNWKSNISLTRVYFHRTWDLIPWKDSRGWGKLIIKVTFRSLKTAMASLEERSNELPTQEEEERIKTLRELDSLK